MYFCQSHTQKAISISLANITHLLVLSKDNGNVQEKESFLQGKLPNSSLMRMSCPQ